MERDANKKGGTKRLRSQGGKMKDDEEGEHNDTCALTLLNHRSKNFRLSWWPI